MPAHEHMRWSPPQELSALEKRMVGRMSRTGKLYRFLRLNRLDLFDEAFQSKLAGMYSDSKRGRPPCAPAMLAMATILQAYTGLSDADAVESACFDLRWQMVLGCVGTEVAPFSQGALSSFRTRLILNDMDRELLRRSVELAKATKGFGYKNLRVALDSAPIWGAGRVEDTFNLIGHALMVCVAAAADALKTTNASVLQAAELHVVGRSSVKAALDIRWDDNDERKRALQRLLADVARFGEWAEKSVPPELSNAASPLAAAWSQVQRIVNQDLEPDPDGDGKRIRHGTAPDRQVSISDPEMRHGRKSKSTTIKGYKGHIAQDLDEGLVLDALALPANNKEFIAADLMRPYIEWYAPVAELLIDRGYLAAQWTTDLFLNGDGQVFCKPWNPSNKGLYRKSDFEIDLASGVVVCPAKKTAAIPSRTRSHSGRRQVWFGDVCTDCALRSKCTESERGRSITLHENEAMLQHLAAAQASPEGRAKLRERTAVEHSLAHCRTYQPKKARYRGTRKNTFGLMRAGVVVNLQAIDRAIAANSDLGIHALRSTG